MVDNPLTVVGIIFLLIAVVVISVQLRAKNCSRHTKVAGFLAWLVAVLCIGTGAYLLFLVSSMTKT